MEEMVRKRPERTSQGRRAVEIGLDPNLVVAVTDPRGGALETLGSLPFDAPPEDVSFDVSGSTGTSFFAVTPTGEATSLWAPGQGLDFLGPIGAGLVLDEIPDCPDPLHLPDQDESLG